MLQVKRLQVVFFKLYVLVEGEVFFCEHGLILRGLFVFVVGLPHDDRCGLDKLCDHKPSKPLALKLQCVHCLTAEKAFFRRNHQIL